jgi:hypothetical protein
MANFFHWKVKEAEVLQTKDSSGAWVLLPEQQDFLDDISAFQRVSSTYTSTEDC